VPLARLKRLAGFAVRKLQVRFPGVFEITFLPAVTMRRLNRKFKGHDSVTDVLSFRYVPGNGPKAPRSLRGVSGVKQAKQTPSVIGEVLIAPFQAQVYAKAKGLDANEELGRYVVHGLLHWLGYEDRTLKEQALMRAREDRLLRASRLWPRAVSTGAA